MTKSLRPARVFSCRASYRAFFLALLASLSLSSQVSLSHAQYGRAAAPQPQPDRKEQSDRKEPIVVPAPSSGAASMSDWHATKLIGATMTDTLGNSIGTVQDIVIDADGKVVAVLVSVGGFLGLGETTVAIGLRHLVISLFDADHLDVRTSLSRDAIEQAARFEPETPPAVSKDQ